MHKFRFGFVYESHLTMKEAIVKTLRKNLVREGYTIFVIKERPSSSNLSIKHTRFKRRQSLYFPSKPYEYIAIIDREVKTFNNMSVGEIYLNAMHGAVTRDVWSIVFIKDKYIDKLMNGIGIDNSHVLEVELNSKRVDTIGLHSKVYPKGTKTLKELLT